MPDRHPDLDVFDQALADHDAAATQDDPTECVCGHPRSEHGDGIVHTACCYLFPPAGSDLDEIDCSCSEFEAV